MSHPRRAATVVLVRDASAGEPGQEVFLVRRHRGASFMSSAFVFPGGVADEGEDDLRLTAARELFEEAGILLADRAIDPAALGQARAALLGGAGFAGVVRDLGVALALDALHPLSRWITPSIEPRRYDAAFFVARLPNGQQPSFDDRETVDGTWLTPAAAQGRSGELRLPPPQIRTLHDLAAAAARGWDALRAEAARRARHPDPILPRAAADGAGVTLLLPWDPDYGRGPGDTFAWPADHALAEGPSRFVLEDGTWRHVAPRSTPTG